MTKHELQIKLARLDERIEDLDWRISLINGARQACTIPALDRASESFEEAREDLMLMRQTIEAQLNEGDRP